MTLKIQPVRIANGEDDHGALVFSGDFLVAVLSRLSSQHEQSVGHWYLECGFGQLAGSNQQFPDFDTAVAWIEAQLASTA